MKEFFENGMKVTELLHLCQMAIEKGYGNAIVEVQANANGISEIIINGFEGLGYEYGKLDCPIFSITSSKNKEQFERCYGLVEDGNTATDHQ